jgi:hypothetical protein
VMCTYLELALRCFPALKAKFRPRTENSAIWHPDGSSLKTFQDAGSLCTKTGTSPLDELLWTWKRHTLPRPKSAPSSLAVSLRTQVGEYPLTILSLAIRQARWASNRGLEGLGGL